jgi:ribosomal protein S6--L-glutamate ligase
MRRRAQGDEFRSNVHRGGVVEGIKLDDVYEATAVRSAQILGLRVAGVDMLEGLDGPQVMEVNSSPGLEGIERATGADIAGEIIDYVADNVAHPEMDIRQRLTVTRGYGVVEIAVGEMSSIVGATLEASGLRERDITVLTLSRDGKTIPNPNASRVLQMGDRLLCFGKYANVRDLLPERESRKVRRR